METTTTEVLPPTTAVTDETLHHIIADGHGKSVDTRFNDEPARNGFIEPNATIEDYEVRSPKILLATHGHATVNGQRHDSGELFTLPVGSPIQLITGPEGLGYISRKVDPVVLADTETRLERLKERGIGDESWWQLPRGEQFSRLQEVIGNTPIERIELGNGQFVHTKRECDNPSGSHYDRAYLETIKHFEEIGFLQPGDELRDITSGSAGISLAFMAYLLGYKARITVPSELPANRLYPMLMLGATLADAGKGYVPAASNMQVAEIEALKADSAWEMQRPADRSGRSFLFSRSNERICYLNHSENELSPRAFEAIAEEIATQVPAATHLALAEGNWTTITGIAPRIRALLPGITIIGYSGELSDGTTQNYGTNVPDVPIRFKNTSLVDQEVIVLNRERDAMQQYAPELGRSSLMGLVVADDIAARSADVQIVTIAYDEKKRY